MAQQAAMDFFCLRYGLIMDPFVQPHRAVKDDARHYAMTYFDERYKLIFCLDFSSRMVNRIIFLSTYVMIRPIYRTIYKCLKFNLK